LEIEIKDELNDMSHDEFDVDEGVNFKVEKKKIKIILNKKIIILLSKRIKILLNKKIIILLSKMFKIFLNMKVKTILTTTFLSNSTQLSIMRLSYKLSYKTLHMMIHFYTYVIHLAQNDEKIRLIHLKIKSHLPLDMRQTFFGPIFL
jgi:hypothetical protein